MRIAIASVVFLFLLAGLSPEMAWAAVSTEVPVVKEGETKPVLLAQQKRKRRKRKRMKKQEDAATQQGTQQAATGTTVHAAHEGEDSHYKYEVGLLSDFAIQSTKVGEAESGQGVYTLQAKMLYILGASFEVGGALDYGETTTKGEDSETVDRSYVLSLLAAYNFGNLDTDKMVFFTNLGVGFGGQTSSATVDDKTTDTKGSVLRLTLGLGLHYFIDSNVALTTQFSYDSDTITVDGADDPTVSSTIHIAKIGFSLFI